MNRKPGKPRAVICLAAGKSQLVVIRKAKELGFSVIAVDRNPAAPGFQLADERIIASTYESVPILSELDRFINEYDIAGVVNRSSGPPVFRSHGPPLRPRIEKAVHSASNRSSRI